LTDYTKELIELFGKEKILKAYTIVKDSKVSFSALKKHIEHEEIIEELKTSKSITAICEERDVSRRTVYRLFHRIIFAR